MIDTLTGETTLSPAGFLENGRGNCYSRDFGGEKGDVS